MSRRLLAVLAALILAGTGGALVFGYTAGADRRALASLDPVEVLVVGDTPIPAGTPVNQLVDQVTVTTVPARAAVPQHLADVGSVEGLVTAAELHPGEQLLAAHFVDPASLDDGQPPALPEGTHEITIPLDGPRALGGRIEAGETVGVVLSHDTPDRSHLHLHKVLVTAVQGGPLADPEATPATAMGSVPETPADGEETTASAPAADPVPENVLLISLAVSTADVEEVIFTAEFGTIWLTREGETVPNDPTAVVTDADLWPVDAAAEGGQE